jgi:glutamate synthase (NADPH/NADH) small chain
VECKKPQKFQARKLLVSELQGCSVEWEKTSRGWNIKEVPGTEFSLKADLVILAMGFLHVTHDGW